MHCEAGDPNADDGVYCPSSVLPSANRAAGARQYENGIAFGLRKWVDYR